MLIIALILFGMVAGCLAWLIVRGGGPRRINWPEAFAAGIVGSFVGGLLSSLIAGDGLSLRLSGLIGSIMGAVIVLVVWGWVRRARRTIWPAPATIVGSRLAARGSGGGRRVSVVRDEAADSQRGRDDG